MVHYNFAKYNGFTRGILILYAEGNVVRKYRGRLTRRRGGMKKLNERRKVCGWVRGIGRMKM